jgi:exodeoxyribonuclease VII large subunit
VQSIYPINYNGLSILVAVKHFFGHLVLCNRVTVDDFMTEEGPNSLQPPVLSVTELNRLVRKVIESSLPLLWVQGEISNFVRAASGHWYFSLKDDAAEVRCTFFRNRNFHLDWLPENGMQVEIRAVPSLYEARGDFQLNVEIMRQAGLGALYEAFEKLKHKLEGEGLFDAQFKKPLPRFPVSLGIVTSPQAAALRDVLSVLRRRMPGMGIIIYPTPVQGKSAGPQIASSIRLAMDRNECEVLILCRGGGSIEDLWCFNDETLARTIAACSIPIVSGVGHETDFTIADFVADLRAPTPTAAAELVSQDRRTELHKLDLMASRLMRSMVQKMETLAQLQDMASRRLTHPSEQLSSQQGLLEQLAARLIKVFDMQLERRQWETNRTGQRLIYQRPTLDTEQSRLIRHATSVRKSLALGLEQRRFSIDRLQSHLQHLNPQAVLERGYSITRNGKGEIVRDSRLLEIGEGLRLSFARGGAAVKVESKE